MTYRIYKGRKVDQELKDEWLDTLNSFELWTPESVCYGHEPLEFRDTKGY